MGVPGGDAGLSVLGIALLMVLGVFVHLPLASLIRHSKADIINTLRKSSIMTGSQ